mmetsp:Transcript_13567/g.13307  ORF Transcript_13567/g.13307 Transcript_13567/m.13307 type:complete len:92 (+) Transcript_13567:165-440(+)
MSLSQRMLLEGSISVLRTLPGMVLTLLIKRLTTMLDPIFFGSYPLLPFPFLGVFFLSPLLFLAVFFSFLLAASPLPNPFQRLKVTVGTPSM